MPLDKVPGAGGEVGLVHHGNVLPVEILDIQLPASLGPGADHEVADLAIPGPVGPVQITRGVQVHWRHPPDLESQHSEMRSDFKW